MLYLKYAECRTGTTAIILAYRHFLLIKRLLSFVAQFFTPCEILIRFIRSRKTRSPIVDGYNVGIFGGRDLDFGLIHRTIVEVGFSDLSLMWLLELDECCVFLTRHNFDLGHVAIDSEKIEQIFGGDLCGHREVVDEND